MSRKKYTLHEIDENQYQLKEDGILQEGIIFSDKEVAEWTVNLLNQQAKEIDDLEAIRQRKNKKIAKLNEREERYQRVIGGMKAYVELESNNDLWWEWNEV